MDETWVDRSWLDRAWVKPGSSRKRCPCEDSGSSAWEKEAASESESEAEGESDSDLFPSVGLSGALAGVSASALAVLMA